MAVELKNRIQNNLGVMLPVVTFLKGPSLAQLATQVMSQLDELIAATEPPATDSDTTVSIDDKEILVPLRCEFSWARQATVDLDDFSDDEVDSLLTNMLAKEDEINERDRSSYP